MNDNSFRVIEVDINEILPNRFQPRIQFDEEEILELSDSIREHGVIQPLVVRTIGNKYEIIAGERRYKASVLAGKETVPVIIKNLNDRDSAEIALIENIQRKNLTPIEEALSYKKILDMGYLTQENLASKLGKSQSSVANKIRLLNLSDEVQEALLDNKISERHARSLLKLKSVSSQNKLLERIINERLTVRRTDEEIERIINNEEYTEKGEIEMNNQIPNVVNQQNNGTFDIFGGVPNAPVQPTMPVQPAVAPVMPEVPTMGGIQFDANGNVVSAAPAIEMPSIDPVAPVAPVQPTMPVQPAVAPAMPEVPTMGGIQFDANGNVVSAAPAMEIPSIASVAPVAPVQPEIPVVPVMEMPSIAQVPQLSPIIEIPNQPVTPVIETPVEPTVPVQPAVAPVMPEVPTTINSEVAMPQPIIITDYSKEYDPIMPNQPVEAPSKVDFKEIINAIRECSQKIEKYGYRIDVEEYDLSTIYQVVFKVEK